MSGRIRLLAEFARGHLPNFEIAGPVPDQQIEQAGEGMELTIPPDYRFFLREYGTLSFGSCEINGIVAGKPRSTGHPSAFGMSRQDIANGYIPPRTLLINSTGYGPVYLLDCSDPPPAVSVYGWDFLDRVEEGMEKLPTFTDFLEWSIRHQIKVQNLVQQQSQRQG